MQEPAIAPMAEADKPVDVVNPAPEASQRPEPASIPAPMLRQEESLTAPQPPVQPALQSEGTKRVVAMLLPLSGKNAVLGHDLLNAAQMALFESADSQFVLRPYDTKSSGEEAGKVAQKALEDGAKVFLGPIFAEEVAAVKPIAQGTGTPILAFSNDRSVAGNDVFIMGAMPDDQIQKIIAFAGEKGLKRLAILAPDTTFGHLVADLADNSASAAGMSITRSVFYNPQAKDFTTPLKELVQYDPKKRLKVGKKDKVDVGFDALLIPASAAQMRQIMPLLNYYNVDKDQVRVLGTSLLDEVANGNDPTFAGVWYASGSPDARKDFEKKYYDTYRKTPPRLAGAAYDATALTAILTKQALAVTPQNLIAFEGFDGVEGLFRLNADGTNSRALSVIEFNKTGRQIVSPATKSLR